MIIAHQHRTQIQHTEFPPVSWLKISRIPRRIPNPFGSKIYERVYEHTRSLDLVLDEQNYFDHITMSAYLWPYTSEDRLSALAYFNTIGYYINDTIANDICRFPSAQTVALRASVAQKAIHILKLRETPESQDKYDRAFLDLHDYIISNSTPEFAARFFSVLLEHWQSAMTNYEDGGIFRGRVDEFITIRRVSSGMIPTIMLIEFAQDRYMPEWLPEHIPSLCLAIDSLADVGGLSNELFSYAKEVLEEGTSFNLLAIIQRTNGMSTLADAAMEAIATVDMAFSAFLVSIDSVCAEVEMIADPEMRQVALDFVNPFIDGMWDIAAACYTWQIETNRYRSERHPFPDLRMKLPI